MVLLGVGVTAFVYNFVSPAALGIEREKITRAALAQAKDALVGYAAGLNYSGTERPGNLPCPDNDGFGFPATSCNDNGVRIGRLPWKTLGLPDLRDGYGEPLWYAVSENFKKATAVGALNTNTPGNLSITGSAPASNVIAIVFSGGPVLGAQDRNPGASSTCTTTGTVRAKNLCPANYLEGGNENADTTFVSGPSTAAFNDRLLAITHDMLFPAVELRVAREARIVLAAFFAARSYLPFANDYSGSPAGCVPSSSGRLPVNPTSCGQDSSPWVWPSWFFGNNWHEIVYYAVAPACTSYSGALCDGAGGFLTVNGASDMRAILYAPGRAQAGQGRPCAAVADCLEDAENTNGDNVYVKPVIGPAVNDRLIVVSP